MRMLWLRHYREQANLSRSELAEMVGITYATVRLHEIQDRKTDTETGEAIAEALGITTEELRFGPGGREAHAQRERERAELLAKSWDETLAYLGIELEA